MSGSKEKSKECVVYFDSNPMVGIVSFGVDEFIGRPQAMGFVFAKENKFPEQISANFNMDCEKYSAKETCDAFSVLTNTGEITTIYFAFYRSITEGRYQHDGEPSTINLLLQAICRVTLDGPKEDWDYFYTNGHIDKEDPPVLPLSFHNCEWKAQAVQKVDFDIGDYSNAITTFTKGELYLSSERPAELGLVSSSDCDFPSFLNFSQFSVLN